MIRILLVSFLMLSFHLVFGLNIDVNSFTFYGEKSYAEIYCRIDRNSVEWKSSEGNKSASVEILLIITNPAKEIVAYDKFVLNSVAKDSIADFIVVKRFLLPIGEYTVKVEATDQTKTDNKIELEQKLTFEPIKKDIYLSDILLLGVAKQDSSSSPLVKNGVYMEPLPYGHAPVSQDKLNFYFEVYASNKAVAGDYYIQYSILDGFKNNLTSNSLLSKYKKWSGESLVPELLSLPINGLRSGDYHLTISIVDKTKNIISSKSINFIRTNPVADLSYLENYNGDLENSFVQKIKAEDMDYVLKALLPITDQNMVATLGELLKSNKLRSQRSFIFQLWKTKSPSNPEDAYNKYMEVARAVDNKFYSNVGYGFQSDRGHLFLKYGKPSNVLSIDTEIDAPPYEIWYYTYLPTTRQTNVRFLFYNPSLSHNDYILLHSTCISERSNPAWETVLYKSVPQDRVGNATDATRVSDNFNRNARRYFNEF